MNDLRKDIQSDLDAGHSLNETDWDEPDDGNNDGNEETPPMHVGRISQAHTQRYTDHNDEHCCVPPLRDIFIFVHHSARFRSQHRKIFNSYACPHALRRAARHLYREFMPDVMTGSDKSKQNRIGSFAYRRCTSSSSVRMFLTLLHRSAP